jgi:hypothetical protein
MISKNSRLGNIWQEERPSRMKVLGVYANRATRWRRNSSPYLTGDLFADNSDIVMYPPKFRGKDPGLRAIKKAQVIFCPSHKVQEFFDGYGDIVTAKVLIAGNSDFEFHQAPENIPATLKQLFLQNSFVSGHPLISTLPIGIENFRWGVNGHPRLMKFGMAWSSRRNQVLIGPFGLTHPVRTIVRETFFDIEEESHFVKTRMSPKSFSTLMQEFKYVGVVRGNGVDTHRLWEALYRGSVPVLTKDAWLESLVGYKFPFVPINEWSQAELKSVVSKEVNLSFDPRKIEVLWWPFWQRKIGEYL